MDPNPPVTPLSPVEFDMVQKRADALVEINNCEICRSRRACRSSQTGNGTLAEQNVLRDGRACPKLVLTLLFCAKWQTDP